GEHHMVSSNRGSRYWYFLLVVAAAGCGGGGSPSGSEFSDVHGNAGGEGATGGSAGSAGAAAGNDGTGGAAGTTVITTTDASALGDSDGSTGLDDPDAACAAEARDSNKIAVDLFIMIDKSISMQCAASDTGCDNPPKMVTPPTRWTAVTDAVKSFLDA